MAIMASSEDGRTPPLEFRRDQHTLTYPLATNTQGGTMSYDALQITRGVWDSRGREERRSKVEESPVAPCNSRRRSPASRRAQVSSATSPAARNARRGGAQRASFLKTLGTRAPGLAILGTRTLTVGYVSQVLYKYKEKLLYGPNRNV